MLLQLGPRHRSADAPAALVLGDDASLGDLLDVDDQLRADDVGAHLDQEICASRQNPRLAYRVREQRDRSVQGIWCLVSHDYLGPLGVIIAAISRPVAALRSANWRQSPAHWGAAIVFAELEELRSAMTAACRD